MNLYEKLAENFHRWEQRGRGTLLHPSPVQLEPPFIQFPGHRVKFEGAVDDGSRPTLLSRFGEKVARALQLRNTPSAPQREEPCEPEPDWFGEEDDLPIELRILLPSGVSYSSEVVMNFVTTLSELNAPVSLEIIGTEAAVWLQIVCRLDDAEVVTQQIEAQFPEAHWEGSQSELQSAWDADDSERVVLDFGLAREFMFPLALGLKSDAYVSMIGAMSQLQAEECAVYQVIFSPLVAPWGEQAMRAVTRESGKPFFDDGADLVKATHDKMAKPLYGVCLRLAAKADSLPRAWEILRGMAPSLRLFSKHGGQSLMPLSNNEYDHEEHCKDFLWRRSRRSGMILNVEELVGLAHIPSASVKCAKFLGIIDSSSRAAPETVAGDGAIILGVNEHRNSGSEVILSTMQRLQHMHCIGASGTGKSTLLLSMILQDLESGQGFALLDPHGDLTDGVLAQIPPDRLDDVVLIDPSDEQYIVPFNVLSAHSDYEKTLLASDLVSVFRRLSTSWGDRMNIIFQNLVLVFLEHRDGGTLADMRRFLVDADWRENFLQGVDDPDVQFYWQHTFPKLDGTKSVGPILTRLETLLTPKIIRYMVSQKANRIDFGEIMDRGRILLMRLPMGQIGKESAFMLGSLIMVKIQQMAMGRARMAAKDRKPFICYVDECQHFVTPSMAEILGGARKYGLGLVLAHQELQQLSANSDVAAAVMTNAATRIVFRVSESDGRALKGDFAHYEPKDFANLPNLHAIARIGRADQDFNLRVIRPQDLDEAEAMERRNATIEASRSRYTVPRSEVEAEIRRQMAADEQTAKPQKASKRDQARSEPPPTTAEEKLGTSQVSAEQVTADKLHPTEAEEQKTTELSENVTPVVDSVSEVESTDSPTRPPGMGRGGQDHQMIVEQLAGIGNSQGYATSKEATVANGRADITLVSKHRRIAFEVAVNSNTSHEIENIEKCLAGGFDFVVSISPNENTLKNIERAARKSLDESNLSKVRFLLPNEVADWLAGLAKMDEPTPAPAAANTKKIGGRTVRVQRVEMSPSERKAMSEQQIEAIAAIVNRNKSEGE